MNSYRWTEIIVATGVTIMALCTVIMMITLVVLLLYHVLNF